MTGKNPERNTMRQCRTCQEHFPETPEYFCRNKKLKGGLAKECKLCACVTRYRQSQSCRVSRVQAPAAQALRWAGFTDAEIADDLSVSKGAVDRFFRFGLEAAR